MDMKSRKRGYRQQAQAPFGRALRAKLRFEKIGHSPKMPYRSKAIRKLLPRIVFYIDT